MTLSFTIPPEGSREFAELARAAAAIKADTELRYPASKTIWARRFEGRAQDFFRELIGPRWPTDGYMAWRAFISAIFCEPFSNEEEYKTFIACTKLTERPTVRPTRIWLPVGRRGGKSRILAAIAVYLAVCFDWKQYLAPGELGVIPVIAQDRKAARTIMNYIKAFLEHPQLRSRVVNDDPAETVTLADNIVIEVVTASFRAVRSRTVIAALCDEIGFWRSEDSSANPDAEIIAALEPAMATIPNALLIGASSPYARKGVLWEEYEKHFGVPGGRTFVWQATTRVMNPSVPQSFIDEKYLEDPLSAAAEYGAEFRTDVDNFMVREALDSVIMKDVQELPFQIGIAYRAFIDPSGGASDSMTLAIGHIDHKTKQAVLDLLREVRPPFSPEHIAIEWTTLLKSYRIGRVKGDRYGGEWVTEMFKKRGIAYIVTDKRKSDIYLEFLPLMNSNKVQLLDNKRLYAQLLGLERRVARGGHESIDHAGGGHDDIANVCAGVLVDLLGKRNPVDIDAGFLLRTSMFPRGNLGNRSHRLDDIRQTAI